MSKKRTLDTFFAPSPSKRAKVAAPAPSSEHSYHPTYPYPVPHLPPALCDALQFCPAEEGRVINDKPDLDLLYFQPYIAKDIEKSLFEYLRQELFFYRVKYMIKRGTVETQINTPRWTTVFGLDETSIWDPEGSGAILDAKSKKPVEQTRYKCCPRPMPQCLEELRKVTEGATGEKYNFCLVNYYASGEDSISYHSDDERFLGPLPAIASFSLGARRDFLLKHKPPKVGEVAKWDVDAKPLKFPLASGDMVLMRGRTQGCWLHSIPKRRGAGTESGRINITFRRAMVKGGTENYYQYNVGQGEPYRWDERRKEMVPWKAEKGVKKDEDPPVKEEIGEQRLKKKEIAT